MKEIEGSLLATNNETGYCIGCTTGHTCEFYGCMRKKGDTPKK